MTAPSIDGTAVPSDDAAKTAAAVRLALLRALTGLERVSPLAPEQVDLVAGAPGCRIELRRVRGSDGVLLWTAGFEVPLHQPLLLAEAIEGQPVIIPLTGRYLKTTGTLAAGLSQGTQYTLLFKSKVAIAIAAGGRAYGEVIARFPKLTVSYIRPGGGGVDRPTNLAAETETTLDFESVRAALAAIDKEGEIVFDQVSYKEIAQAGSAGFGGFQDGN